MEGVGAVGAGGGLGGAPTLERGARELPEAGRELFDQQHVAKIGLAAVALRFAAMACAAGGATVHGDYEST